MPLEQFSFQFIFQIISFTTLNHYDGRCANWILSDILNLPLHLNRTKHQIKKEKWFSSTIGLVLIPPSLMENTLTMTMDENTSSHHRGSQQGGIKKKDFKKEFFFKRKGNFRKRRKEMNFSNTMLCDQNRAISNTD